MGDVFGGAKVIYVARIEKETAQTEPCFGDEITHPWDNERGDLLAYYSRLTDLNAYHSRCLRIKSDCTVNLGVDVVAGNETTIHKRLEVVNPYGQSFQEVIARVALDYETTGNGYLEVVRGMGDGVEELYHCPAVLVNLRPRSAPTPFYYRNESEPVPFPAFKAGKKDFNALLHFANYTQADRYYGLPDWRGAAEDIELNYYAVLYNKSFFINSGIPDIAIIVEGGKFDEETEAHVVSFFQQNFKGAQNSHRTLILPIDAENVKVRFEKLTVDMKDRDGSFEKLRASCRDNIVSAHGVPPRLAGIVASGQLGGGGEVQGQLKTFQEITIGPRQSLFQTKLNPVIRDMGYPEAEIQFRKMDVSMQEADSTYYPAMVNAGILGKEESRHEMGYSGKAPEQGATKPKAAPDQGKADPAGQLAQSLEAFRKAL